MEHKVDMIPFLLEAFAHKQSMRSDIDSLYQQNKYEYYKIAKESKYYNHQILLEGDIFRQEYGRKMLGIILQCEGNNTVSDQVMALIQKHYRKIYNLVKNNDIITMEMFIKAVYGNKSKISTTPDDETNSYITILIFLCMQFEKQIEENAGKYLHQSLLDRVEFYNPNNKLKIKYSNLDSKLIERTKSLKKRLHEHDIKITNFHDMVMIQEGDIFSWCGGLAFLFDYENISAPSIYENIEFTDQDIEEILSSYYYEYKNQNVQDASRFLISSIYLKYLIKAYKQLKEYYFANNKETMFVELEGIEQENTALKKQIENMQTKLIEQDSQINVLKQQVKNEYKRAEAEFQNEYRKLLEQNKQLEQTIKELKKNETELAALREMMFSLEQDQDYDMPKRENIDTSQINRSSIIIVGGHPNWQSQIKSKLPNVRLVDTDALNFNPDSLSGLQYMIFNTAYMNHGMYYKMVNYARSNNIKIGYITNQNIDLSIQQIYNTFNK